jgi:HEAT repeat protein
VSFTGTPASARSPGKKSARWWSVFLIAAVGCGGQDVEAHIGDLSHPESKVRLRASYQLIKLGAAAVEPLISRAATGSDSLRYISAQILGRIGDARALPALKTLTRDPNNHVRRQAFVALGSMGDPELVEFLAVTLYEDPLADLRAAAAEGLASLGDTLAVPSLVRALQDTAASVRKQSVVALNQLWTSAAETAVARALSADRDETVRYVATQALGQHDAVGARDHLRVALQDSSKWVRTEAARSLGMLGDPVDTNASASSQ